MNKSKIILEDKRENFFRRHSIDDDTFLMWKHELEKELPSFWESMKK